MDYKLSNFNRLGTTPEYVKQKIVFYTGKKEHSPGKLALRGQPRENSEVSVIRAHIGNKGFNVGDPHINGSIINGMNSYDIMCEGNTDATSIHFHTTMGEWIKVDIHDHNFILCENTCHINDHKTYKFVENTVVLRFPEDTIIDKVIAYKD
jgi:hypothetical protein